MIETTKPKERKLKHKTKKRNEKFNTQNQLTKKKKYKNKCPIYPYTEAY